MNRESVCPFDGDAVDNIAFARLGTSVALYNISPILPGHSLIVPRRHVDSVLKLRDQEMWSLFDLARRVTPILLATFRATGFDWTLQDGDEAGRTVPHVHLHVIPRIEGDLDSPGDWYPELELQRQRQYRDQRGGDSLNRPRSHPEHTEVIVNRLRSETSQVGLYEA